MKNIVLLFLFLLNGCAKPYSGFVYDYDKKTPISGVSINDYLNGKKVVTNSDGYFLLKKDGKMSSILIFSLDGYVTDTIKSIQIHNGEEMEEKFKGEIIYLFNEKSTFRDSIYKINNIK